MESGIERMLGHKLLLGGPLMDQYLEHIGHAILKKLSQKHLTGYVLPLKVFIPNQIFLILMRLFVAYGCESQDVYPKVRKSLTRPKRKLRKVALNKPPTKSFIWMNSMQSCEKIFAPERFDGTNFLAKRVFARKLLPGQKKQQQVYNGKAVVVVTSSTPIKLEYIYKTGMLAVSFTIQRYSADGIAHDSKVQAEVNSADD